MLLVIQHSSVSPALKNVIIWCMHLDVEIQDPYFALVMQKYQVWSESAGVEWISCEEEGEKKKVIFHLTNGKAF